MYYARERKQIKRQLEIIKDTEYANFLVVESENLKGKVWKNDINKTHESNENVKDESD